MERFKSSTRPRYHPTISLTATLECDAVVRTVSDHRSLTSLLTPHIPTPDLPKTRLISAPLSPPVWVDATRLLETSLSTPSATRNVASLVAAYAHQLEDVTAVAVHDFFAEPILYACAAWVGEPDLLPNLTALSPPPEAHVLLVARQTRQDDAARDPAIAKVSQVYGPDNVHLVLLDDDSTTQSPASTAAKLDSLARDALAARIADLSKSADKARRATRSTFRSWFSAPPTRTLDDTPPTDRRLSLSGRAPPQFPADSVEAMMRRLADLYMMSGLYAEATDAYRLLVTDLRGLVGAAVVHEASALEMGALALALQDGSKQAIGTALEKTIAAYCAAGRRELAARATLRAVDFCMEAGFPDSAAGVISRAIDAILPDQGVATPAGSAFVEGALAVLSAACSIAYQGLRRRRRASLYAFLGASRLSKLKLHAAAACLAHDIDEKALLRRPVRDDVEIMFGAAESAEGRHGRAIAHFTSVLVNVDERTDVELQGSAVQGFLTAAFGANDAMAKRWDAGASFPLVEMPFTRVVTHDSSGGDEWRSLEDDVLEDAEFFLELAKSGTAKRERRIEVIANELRQRRNAGNGDPGGSLEMKIKRMRDLAEARRKRRRTSSLLERGAVVRERVGLHVSLRNPLQFPVFVNSLSAVVLLDGQVYNGRDERMNGVANGGDALWSDVDQGHESNRPIQFFPAEDITLMPCSSQRVSLEVAIQKEGDARFIGLVWNFTIGKGGASSEVTTPFAPGFCVLERQGRRLNDSRRHRASEVPLYEEDKSLSIRVTPLAPKLRATLLCKEDGVFEKGIESLTLRAGEKREAKLILENEGHVSLDSVVVRIGTMRTLFVDITPEKEHKDDGKAVFAIGMHDETVQQDELIAAARVTVKLPPKGKREIPVWVRAAVQSSAFGYRSGLNGKIQRTNVRVGATGHIEDGVASCHAKLVLAYGAQNMRVTRVEAEMKVRPSLIVSPRFLREADPNVIAQGEQGLVGVLLGVEVEHGGLAQKENAAFEVTDLSVTSRSGWKPMLLPAPALPTDSSADEICPSSSNLRINETATFFVLVVREDLTTGNSTDEKRRFSPWRTFLRRLAKPSDPSTRTTISSVDTKLEEHLTEQRASTHFVVCSHSTASSLRSSERELAYVAVRWKTASDVSGEIHIPPIDPLRWMKDSKRPRAGNDAASKSKEEFPDLVVPRITEELEGSGEPIVLTVRHPSMVEHDFFPSTDADSSTESAAAFPAVVPVDVSVKNVSTALLDVAFVAPTVGGIADGDRGRYWAGDVSMTLRSLPPGADRVLSLTAVLTSPGRYNMSKFTVLYQSSVLTALRLRKQVHMEPSYMNVQAVGNVLPFERAPSPTMPSKTFTRGRKLLSPITSSISSAEPVLAKLDSHAAVRAEKEVNMMKRSPGVKPVGARASSEPPNVDVRPKREGRPRRASLGRSGADETQSQSSAQRKTVKLLPPSPDDAFWNAADTDESD